MKKLVLSIVSVLALNTINNQQEMYASANNLVFGKGIYLTEWSEIKSNYEKEVESFDFSSEIKKLQKEIAEYDITKDLIYDDSEKSIYDVTFNRKTSKAKVAYNNNGEIIGSLEKYKNVKLPASLRFKILKDNPEFAIDGNRVTIKYHNSLGATISYKVTISNGKQRKTLKFDKNYNLI